MTQENKNFRLGVANGAFFMLASTFISGNIVMPLFLQNFTGSKALIGLASAFLSLGWFLPQFFEGYFAEKKSTRMPIYRFAAWIRMVAFALLTFAVILLAENKTAFSVTVIMTLIFFYAFSGGISGLAFMDLVAKTIPVRRRGAFFGARLFFGGVLSLGGSWVVGKVISSEELVFPFNFVLLFLLAFIMISTAILLYMRVKEPAGHGVINRSFRDYYEDTIESVKQNSTYRRLIVTRWLCGASSIAFPFYVLNGINTLGISKNAVGAFLVAQVLGGIISNMFWGRLGDKKGNKLLLQLYAGLSLAAPAIALMASIFAPWKELYVLVFLILGIADSGATIGFFNFLLEISPESKRSSHIGFMHTVISPVLLISMLGGLLMDRFSGVTYNYIFLIAGLFGIAGLIMTFKLKEPRGKA
ncbi:MAG: MFS transporter [Candidatus Firestonebacteria bacterium]